MTNTPDIVVTGKRPGEKMFEGLFYDDASAAPTRHPKILRAIQGDTRELGEAMNALGAALKDDREADARRVLFDTIN